ncbi:hypothetical protein QAD02_008235 [Eretmocerus hayati]|uniref:Uncharacterized protein n=1 Tax=Eretmocerus hayati TaxID=131215 RepID=A0ACC2N782_9HYME|nr:hypothetical protein QAD02_008235 [Eretmocerus hayati]
MPGGGPTVAADGNHSGADDRGGKVTDVHDISRDEPAFLLSAQEVFDLIDKVTEQNEVLLGWFRSVKYAEKKVKIGEAISSINATLNKLSSAYLSSLAAHRVNEAYRNDFLTSCKKFDQAIPALNVISAGPVTTYANIIRQPTTEPSQKVSLPEGKSFPIKVPKQIVIGPTEASGPLVANSSVISTSKVPNVG